MDFIEVVSLLCYAHNLTISASSLDVLQSILQICEAIADSHHTNFNADNYICSTHLGSKLVFGVWFCGKQPCLTEPTARPETHPTTQLPDGTTPSQNCQFF